MDEAIAVVGAGVSLSRRGGVTSRAGGGCRPRAGGRRVRCPPTGGPKTSRRFRRSRWRIGCPTAASWTVTSRPTSRNSSASTSRRLRGWTPGTGCCGRWPGKPGGHTMIEPEESIAALEKILCHDRTRTGYRPLNAAAQWLASYPDTAALTYSTGGEGAPPTASHDLLVALRDSPADARCWAWTPCAPASHGTCTSPSPTPRRGPTPPPPHWPAIFAAGSPTSACSPPEDQSPSRTRVKRTDMAPPRRLINPLVILAALRGLEPRLTQPMHQAAHPAPDRRLTTARRSHQPARTQRTGRHLAAAHPRPLHHHRPTCPLNSAGNWNAWASAARSSAAAPSSAASPAPLTSSPSSPLPTPDRTPPTRTPCAG